MRFCSGELSMDLMNKYPRLSDLRKPAAKRIPKFVYAYLDSGTGHERAKDENRAFLDGIELTPQFMRGRVDPDLTTKLGSKTFKAPFGAGPIGLSSLIWPGAESIIARAAKKYGFPYTLSTVAGESIEMVADSAGEMGWFQLYAPRDRDLMRDLLRRAKDCGVTTLVVTADVPSPSRRERMRIAGAPLGSRGNSAFSPRVIWQSMLRPEWAVRTLLNGGARFRNMEPYAKNNGTMGITKFIGDQLNGSLDWDYLAEIRAEWDGEIYLKGVLHGQDAARAVKLGVDGVVVSNHGGRQLDGAVSSIVALPPIVDAVNDRAEVWMDSGIRSGQDVLRAIALGAQGTMIGRAFLYGLGAKGQAGVRQALDIIYKELDLTLGLCGQSDLSKVDSSILIK